MIEFVDMRPDTSVQLAEYKRLLGYPRDKSLKDRAAELAEQASTWYAGNGRPWVYARQSQSLEITNGSIRIDGVSFSSRRLQSMLRQAESESVFLVAVSAGGELEQEAARLWRDEKPDEYFFLEVYGSAVVEHLVTMCGAQLCEWADSRGLAVLPHYSPGYPEWDIAQQPRLLALMRRNERQGGLPGDVGSLDSGMLCPKKSLLAVFGVTKHTSLGRQLAELSPCESCSYSSCQYRRAPYLGVPLYPEADVRTEVAQILTAVFSNGSKSESNAAYSINKNALARWAAERLTLTTHANGTIEALFKYEGKTCSNLGRPILFHYRVKLGTKEKGYPIREQWCGPAPGDRGHESMCGFMEDSERLMSAVETEKPLLGQPLDDVLSWEAVSSAAGCYCQASDRTHKWRIVLETVHYALAQRDSEPAHAVRERAVVL